MIAWNFYDGLSGVARGGCGVDPAPSLKLHAAYSQLCEQLKLRIVSLAWSYKKISQSAM